MSRASEVSILRATGADNGQDAAKDGKEPHPPQRVANSLSSRGILACVMVRTDTLRRLAVLVVAAAPHVSAQPVTPRYASIVHVFDLGTRTDTVVLRRDGVWEAPNWSRDGDYLLLNSDGRLYRLPPRPGASPAPLDLDPTLRCNNDHDLSPDGRLLALSASSPASPQSQVYVADADGSSPRLVVAPALSYFHGWSPDGRWLSFVGKRDGQQFDIYRVATAGGAEERLTTDTAHDDGSDYSRDGRWIFFNSDRGGDGNIWRMPSDGAGAGDRLAERITSDAFEDWFPHPSPDGARLLFLSFPAGTQGHSDRALKVRIRMLPMPGDRITPVVPEVVAEFTGGQGTLNVNSWSPDSTRFAYVSYERVGEP